MDKFSYNQAIEQIQAILIELQSDNCDIDTMVKKTSQAAELIKKCRDRLVATEEELKSALDMLKPTE